jgi:hypothetical protein
VLVLVLLVLILPLVLVIEWVLFVQQGLAQVSGRDGLSDVWLQGDL